MICLASSRRISEALFGILASKNERPERFRSGLFNDH
jgi:hypothetical protein